MNRIHRIAIILFTTVAALTMLPAVASAATYRPVRFRPTAVSTAQYQRQAQQQMNRSLARIHRRIRHTRLMSRAMRRTMLINVNEGIRLINQRIDSAGRDGKITLRESQYIHHLASAVSADLRRTYNNFDSFVLL